MMKPSQTLSAGVVAAAVDVASAEGRPSVSFDPFDPQASGDLFPASSDRSHVLIFGSTWEFGASRGRAGSPIRSIEPDHDACVMVHVAARQMASRSE